MPRRAPLDRPVLRTQHHARPRHPLLLPPVLPLRIRPPLMPPVPQRLLALLRQTPPAKQMPLPPVLLKPSTLLPHRQKPMPPPPLLPKQKPTTLPRRPLQEPMPLPRKLKPMRPPAQQQLRPLLPRPPPLLLLLKGPVPGPQLWTVHVAERPMI